MVPIGPRTVRRFKDSGLSAIPLGTLTAVCLVFYGATAVAEPDAISLDEVLKHTLALGDGTGCGKAFGISESGVEGLFGKELTAICRPSAVNSAAALGGSLGSLQTTKTVSQFRMVRRRVDSRLGGVHGKRFGLSVATSLNSRDKSEQPAVTDSLRLDSTRQSRFGAFTQVEYELQDRATSRLEAGYEANISQGLIGFDYVTAQGILAGGWVAFATSDADYVDVRFQSFDMVVAPDLGLLSEICKLSPGGGFVDEGVRLGGFAGTRFGSGFADIAVQYSQRNYDYHRNVCTVEAPSRDVPFVRDANSATGFTLDDIYAGTISGQTTLTAWSVSTRAGLDFGTDRFLWGPRVSATALRSTISGLAETGQTSVTNTVTSPGGLQTVRNPGEPTGLELVFEERTRTSLQAEGQLVVAYRFNGPFGELIPRLSASWIHEFQGERQLVTVQMAQDLRPSPTRFSFTTESTDKNKGNIAIGTTALVGTQFAADLAITYLVADSNFSSTSVTAQARWQF